MVLMVTLPSLAETLRAFYGCWRLLRGDVRALSLFAATADGFWRSFTAALWALPPYGVIVAKRYALLSAPPPLARYLLLEAVFYVIVWIAYPLAMVTACRMMDRQRRYYLYMTIYNWSGVLQTLALVVALGLGLAVSPSIAVLLILAVQGAILIYIGFIARVSLEIPVLTAAGVVLLAFLLEHIVFATKTHFQLL